MTIVFSVQARSAIIRLSGKELEREKFTTFSVDPGGNMNCYHALVKETKLNKVYSLDISLQAARERNRQKDPNCPLCRRLAHVTHFSNASIVRFLTADGLARIEEKNQTVPPHAVLSVYNR